MRRPPKIKLGRVIARRELTEYTGDSIRRVVISIGAPRPHPKGDWECPFLIEAWRQSRVEHAMGVDALQALLLAVEGVWTRLDQTGSRFEWLGPELGTGIPRPMPMLGKSFDKRLNRFVERETARHWDSRFKIRKARIAEFEAELEERKKTVATWDAVLRKRKALAAAAEANLKAQKNARTDKAVTRVRAN
jgi:hypothetical protein